MRDSKLRRHEMPVDRSSSQKGHSVSILASGSEALEPFVQILTVNPSLEGELQGLMRL